MTEQHNIYLLSQPLQTQFYTQIHKNTRQGHPNKSPSQSKVTDLDAPERYPAPKDTFFGNIASLNRIRPL